ncbi:MAG: FkbM family methyltransferase [Pseudomonadales bacterium]|nr:FkbM family methyltransferase [Pseudomonadales bacterium]
METIMTVDWRSVAGLARSLSIYYGQPWKARALKRFYAALIPSDSLVFDIGAHVGNRSRILHSLGCRVLALEPQPLFLRFLKFALPRDGITVLASAVAARPGRMLLNISRRHPTVTSLSVDWIDKVSRTAGFAGVVWDKAMDVDVTTLDQLIADHGRPYFIKIDVEGMEADILAGLSQPVPLIAFEYLPAMINCADACLERLSELGAYQFRRVEGETADFVDDTWMSAAAMLASLRQLKSDGGSGDIYARLQK